MRRIARQCDRRPDVADAALTLFQLASFIVDSERIRVNLTTNVALVNGRRIALGPKQAELLACLIPPGFVPYRKILFGVWGRDAGTMPMNTQDSLHGILHKLRQVLSGTGFEIRVHREHGMELIYRGRSTVPPRDR